VGAAVWFYEPLVNALQRQSGAKLTSETLREFSQKHAAALWPKATTFAYLIEAYYQARFSPQPTRLDTAALRAALASVKKSA
jgi:hypothetical protein